MTRVSLCTIAVLSTIGIFTMANYSVAGYSFPASALPGQSIGGELPSGYEPSGIVWHTRLNQLIVVSDDGRLSYMTSNGDVVANRYLSGDLEGICVANPDSDFVYVGVEGSNSIIELSITTGLVRRTFDLTIWMTSPANLGLEALTFVPDENNPEGGLFYAGLQEDGQIYTFQLPIASSSTSTTVTYQGTITAAAGRTDISGLNYDMDQQVLYAIYDSSNTLLAMTVDGTSLKEWQLPGNNQEGIALHNNVLYIAEDSGQIMRYSPFYDVPEPSTLVLLTMSTLVGLAVAWRKSFSFL